MVRNYRKPLLVVAPKTLLRAPACQSTLSDMSEGQGFQAVLGDPTAVNSAAVKRVVFVSGKQFYTLDKERQDRNINDTAIVRLEVGYVIVIVVTNYMYLSLLYMCSYVMCLFFIGIVSIPR